jgi:hypothetical protein
MNVTMPDISRNSERGDKTVQTLLNVVLATVSVIAVTYLTKRREYPVEAVFDAGMDYQRRCTASKAATA